jgi:hypothetical protein
MASPQRPDLAVMQATLPTPSGPTSVDLQAAAQRAVDAPHLMFAGRRWTFVRTPDMFDLGELGEAIEGAEADPIGALGVISRCLRTWLADYPGLRAAFREQYPDGGGAAGMQAYARLAQDVFVAVTARPTEAPDDSSPGRSSTSTSSKAAPTSADPAWFPPPSHE